MCFVNALDGELFIGICCLVPLDFLDCLTQFWLLVAKLRDQLSIATLFCKHFSNTEGSFEHLIQVSMC